MRKTGRPLDRGDALRHTGDVTIEVSLAAEFVGRVDELAAELGKSRSELCRDALAEYLERRETCAITASWDAVVAEVGREFDPWVAETSQRTFERNEW
jgi:predicted transcriptional regulator